MVTASDNKGVSKSLKLPRWAATDPFFKSLFEEELKIALARQRDDPFVKIETFKDTLKQSWFTYINEKLGDDSKIGEAIVSTKPSS